MTGILDTKKEEKKEEELEDNRDEKISETRKMLKDQEKSKIMRGNKGRKETMTMEIEIIDEIDHMEVRIDIVVEIQGKETIEITKIIEEEKRKVIDRVDCKTAYEYQISIIFLY